MPFFSFRNRNFLRRIGLWLLILCLILVLAAVGVFIYLQRFLVYGKDGVYLDFSRPPISEPVQGDPEPELSFPNTEIVEVDPEELTPTVSTTVLSGYVVPHSVLQQPQAFLDACLAMEEPCTLLFDIKDGVGNFFYASSVADQGEDSRDLLSAVLQQLQEEGFHLVARVSALRDRSFGLNNPRYGLPLSSGALWMDAGGCYWLDPAKDTVQVRLIRICSELFELGFSEVVLSNFYFPESKQIVYKSEEEPQVILSTTFQRIQAALEGKGLVSIQLQEEQEPLDPGTGRLYYSTQEVLVAQNLHAATQEWLEDPASQLVFLTDSRDTRFEGYGLLRSWDE